MVIQYDERNRFEAGEYAPYSSDRPLEDRTSAASAGRYLADNVVTCVHICILQPPYLQPELIFSVKKHLRLIRVLQMLK
jgi:hypothetical protein